MIDKLKNKFLTGLLAGTLAFAPVKDAFSGIKGSIEAIFSQRSENDYVRLMTFYGNPKKTSGLSFLELYKGEGYFGKTMLRFPFMSRKKEFLRDICGKLEIIHDNHPAAEIGLGFEATLIGEENGNNFRFKYLPIFINKTRDFVEEKHMIGYSFFVKLGKTWEFCGFGEFNFLEGRWEYGEFALTKNFGRLGIGYNPALKAEENDWNPNIPMPVVENRIHVKIDLSKPEEPKKDDSKQRRRIFKRRTKELIE